MQYRKMTVYHIQIYAVGCLLYYKLSLVILHINIIFSYWEGFVGKRSALLGRYRLFLGFRAVQKLPNMTLLAAGIKLV
jgi:hypothetical protein